METRRNAPALTIPPIRKDKETPALERNAPTTKEAKRIFAPSKKKLERIRLHGSDTIPLWYSSAQMLSNTPLNNFLDFFSDHRFNVTFSINFVEKEKHRLEVRCQTLCPPLIMAGTFFFLLCLLVLV